SFPLDIGERMMHVGESATNLSTQLPSGQSTKFTTPMGQVYSIASQKGGTGKSSTSISVSAGLARMGKRVLLIDIDSQANSSKVLLSDYQTLKKDETLYATILDRKPLPRHPTSVPGLELVPSHIL